MVIDATTAFPDWGGERGNLRDEASHFLGQRDLDLRRAEKQEQQREQELEQSESEGRDPPDGQVE